MIKKLSWINLCEALLITEIIILLVLAIIKQIRL